jgi:dTDP-4-dehydrorhamnose 3,5-epimerase-like enzyme
MNMHITQLPKFLDDRGNLSFVQNNAQIPFEIKRVHWIYDVPGAQERGGVAYKETEEFIIAMSGSFDVVINDGKTEYKYSLNRSYKGVYVPKGTWRTIENFSTNSVAVILASTLYDAKDTISDIEEFRTYVSNSGTENQSSVVENDKNETLNFVKSSVYDCNIIELNKHHSQRKGNISVVENQITVPFSTKRIYYLYDVPGGETRGGHAHKNLYQLIIAASGSFTVTLDDGNVKRTFMLNRPYQGLPVKPGIWRTLDDFSSGSVCLVLASEVYDESDYIRTYDEFLKYRGIQ